MSDAVPTSDGRRESDGSGVFVSYRRVDVEPTVVVYSWLTERFGRDAVFWDAEDIAASAPWASEIRESVRAASALVVVIGKGWAELKDANGNVRLLQPRDWVRQEIELALELDLPIVPVVAPGADIPDVNSLPDTIAPLLDRQAVLMKEMKARRQLLKLLETYVPVVSDERSEEVNLDRLAWLLERQVQRLQTRAVELVQEGRTDRARYELEEGVQLLLELVALMPMSLRISGQLGYLYATLESQHRDAGDAEGAEKYLGLAEAVFTDLIDKANGLLSEHDDLSTTELARDLEALASSVNGYGGVQLKRGQIDEAIATYNVVVRMAPGYGYAWHDLIAALLTEARDHELRVDEIVTALDALKEVGPGHPGIGKRKLADMERRVGDAVAAAAHRSITERKYQRAIGFCDSYVDTIGPDRYVLGMRAWAHDLSGDHLNALADYDTIIDESPSDPGFRIARAGTRLALDDPAGALEDTTAAMRMRPLPDQGYRTHIEALRRLGRTDEAEEFVARATADGRIASDPRSSP